MSDIRLTFHRVTDARPEKSCTIIAIYHDDDGEISFITEMPYSKKWNAFNVHDYNVNTGTEIQNDEMCWAYLDEFKAKLKWGINDGQSD